MSDKILDLRLCDYSGKDLSGKTLSGALLENAKLPNTNLREAVMSKVGRRGPGTRCGRTQRRVAPRCALSTTQVRALPLEQASQPHHQLRCWVHCRRSRLSGRRSAEHACCPGACSKRTASLHMCQLSGVHKATRPSAGERSMALAQHRHQGCY